MKFTMVALISVVIFLIIGEFCDAFISSPKPLQVRSKSTVVMDGKTRILRDRIKSVKNTRRITEAMRLVAAARVRRAQDAVLKTRPLIAQLQLVILTPLYIVNNFNIQFFYRFIRLFWMHVTKKNFSYLSLKSAM